MGYKKVPTIHTLDSIDGEDGLVVRLKSVSFGKVRRLLKLVEGSDEQEVMNELVVSLERAIVSWNLEDEDGPVGTDLASIEAQEFDFVLKIINTWLDKMTGVSSADGDLGKGSPSGESFPGRPLTMEAL